MSGTAAASGRLSVDVVCRRLSYRLATAPLADVEAHRLELIVAAELRRRRQAVPAALEAAERMAAVTMLAAPAILTKIRRAYDGRILLLKGPEIAARYPEPGLRSYTDIDILVEDARAARDALLDAGFREVGKPRLYEDIHHLPPVVLPALGLPVEIHSRPKWVDGHTPPDVGLLFADAVPSAVGVAGIEAPRPSHHVLLVAAHSWAHEPLRRLRDLLDIVCLEQACEPGEVDQLARMFGAGRLWSSTRDAVETVTRGVPLPLPTRIWARNVELCRERTVLESHLTRWLSGFAVQPPLMAFRGLREPLQRTFAADEERVTQKIRRSFQALRNARVRRSEHEAAVGALMPPPVSKR